METALQNLSNLVQGLLPRLLQAVGIVLTAWLGTRLVRLAARQMKDRLISEGGQDGRTARLITLNSLAAQISRGVIIILAAFTLLGTFGVNLGPVLASLGVVGLAISLGAQTLIKDYFGGLMILIENQFVVGDWVTIGPVSGTVERMSFRLTTLRDLNGKLHTIPNGDVRMVTNSSRDWSLAIVDINLDLGTDLEKAMEVLEKAAASAAKDPALAEALMGAPQVQGWNKLLDWAVQVRLSARTYPGQRAAAEIELRRYALEALQSASIRLAHPLREPQAN